MTTGEGWSTVGGITFRVESPEFLHTRVHGDVDGAIMRGLFELVRDVSSRIGRPCYWLHDLSTFRDFTPDARRVAADLDPSSIAATAVYGGTFRQRIAANMLVRAGALLGRPVPPARFCAGEAEARVFLDAQRRRDGRG